MGVSGISISKIQLLALEKAAAESFAGSEGPYYRALLEKMLREFGGATAQKRHLPSGALLIRALCNAASKGGRALWSDAAVEFMHVNYGGRSGLSQLLSAAEKAAGEAWEMIGCECGCPLGYHVANACDPRIRATLEEKAA